MRTLLIFLIIACGILLTSCEGAIDAINGVILGQGDSQYPWEPEEPDSGTITIIITWGDGDSPHPNIHELEIPKGSEWTYEWSEE